MKEYSVIILFGSVERVERAVNRKSVLMVCENGERLVGGCDGEREGRNLYVIGDLDLGVMTYMEVLFRAYELQRPELSITV